jgi:hypothetical protein
VDGALVARTENGLNYSLTIKKKNLEFQWAGLQRASPSSLVPSSFFGKTAQQTIAAL